MEHGSVQGKKREYNLLTLANHKITDKQKSEVYGTDSQKLLPTDLGYATNDFLVKQFPEILNYDFTANEEANFDKIAEGKAKWVEKVDEFYHTFHPLIEKVPSGKVASRQLGNDPVSGLPVIAKITKLGPCVQLGDSDDEKPKFVSLKRGQSIYTITLNEALELFSNALPYSLGELNGEEIVIGEGKYGPYFRYKGQFVSIPKSIDPRAITMEQVKQLLEEKEQKQEPLRTFGDIQILNGRYGAYIKAPEGNFRLPKNVKVDSLTENDVKTLISASFPRKSKK